MGGYEPEAYEIWWAGADTASGKFAYELLFNDTKPFVRAYTHRNKADVTPATGDSIGFTTNAIIGGAQYKFRYRAINIHSFSYTTP